MNNTANTTDGQPLTGGTLFKWFLRLVVGVCVLDLIVVLGLLPTLSRYTGRPIGEVLPLSATGTYLNAWTFPTVFLEVLLVLTLEITVHELGHVVGGRLARFKFMFMTIGPLRISHDERGLKLSKTEAWLPQLGGALSVPLDAQHLRRRTMLTIAAGPLASLALGLSSLTLALNTHNALTGMFELSAWMSLCSAAMNFMPLKSGMMLSDGARLKMLLEGGPAGERYCLLSALTGASLSGQRPSQWNPQWIEGMQAVEDGTVDSIAASHVAFYWLLDTGNIDAAEQALEKLLAGLNLLHPSLHRMLYAEAAFFYTYYRHNSQQSRPFLDKLGAAEHGPHFHMQARAIGAALLLEGKVDQAKALANEGLAHMRKAHTRGPGWELDHEWLQVIACATQNPSAEPSLSM